MLSAFTSYALREDPSSTGITSFFFKLFIFIYIYLQSCIIFTVPQNKCQRHTCHTISRNKCIFLDVSPLYYSFVMKLKQISFHQLLDIENSQRIVFDISLNMFLHVVTGSSRVSILTRLFGIFIR